jgi:hypothetical protein
MATVVGGPSQAVSSSARNPICKVDDQVGTASFRTLGTIGNMDFSQ